MIKALLFDFDGLVLETEGPIYKSWLETFQAHQCDLPFSLWAEIIGTDETQFDPLDLLEQQSKLPFDREEVRLRRLRRELELIHNQEPMPGVVDYLETARRLGLRTAVVSSSDRQWVAGHLERLGLLHYFDTLCTRDDVEHSKPYPDLYLLALDRLHIQAEEALAFEDSSHGVAAAREAGVFVVAVPSNVTKDFNFDHAGLRIESLAEISLPDLLKKVEQARARKEGGA